MVVTVRNDELHRRHPFRTTLAELGRIESARRVELGPLGRDEIAELIRERSGTDGSSESVDDDPRALRGKSVVRRGADRRRPGRSSRSTWPTCCSRASGGCLSSPGVSCARPRPTARAWTSRSWPSSPGSTPRISRGSFVKPSTDTCSASAATCSSSATGCCARPSTTICSRGNARAPTPPFAEALQARVDEQDEASLSQLSRLAFHWSQAHDPARTLAASVRAGERARQFGTAEAVTHLERAVALWDRVTDPRPSPSGRSRSCCCSWHAPARQRARERFEALAREAVARAHGPTRTVWSPAASTRPRPVPACRRTTRIDDDGGSAPRPGVRRRRRPVRSWPSALAAQSPYHHRRGHGHAALEAAAEQAAPRWRDRPMIPLRDRGAALLAPSSSTLLGRVAEAVVLRERTPFTSPGRRAGSAMPCSRSATWRGSSSSAVPAGRRSRGGSPACEECRRRLTGLAVFAELAGLHAAAVDRTVRRCRAALRAAGTISTSSRATATRSCSAGPRPWLAADDAT